jgi:hypothetical protein
MWGVETRAEFTVALAKKVEVGGGTSPNELACPAELPGSGSGKEVWRWPVWMDELGSTAADKRFEDQKGALGDCGNESNLSNIVTQSSPAP